MHTQLFIGQHAIAHTYRLSFFILLLSSCFCLGSATADTPDLFIQKFDMLDIPTIKKTFSLFNETEQHLIFKKSNEQQQWLLNKIKKSLTDKDDTFHFSHPQYGTHASWAQQKPILKISQLEGITPSHIESLLTVYDSLYYETIPTHRDLVHFAQLGEKSSNELRNSFKIWVMDKETWRKKNHEGIIVHYRPKHLSLSYVLEKSLSPHFFYLLAFSHAAMLYSYYTIPFAQFVAQLSQEEIIEYKNRLVATQEFIRELHMVDSTSGLLQTQELIRTLHIVDYKNRLSQAQKLMSKLKEHMHPGITLLLQNNTDSLQSYDDFFSPLIKQKEYSTFFKYRFFQSFLLYPVALIPGILPFLTQEGLSYEIYKTVSCTPFHWKDISSIQMPFELLIRSFFITVAINVIGACNLILLSLTPDCLSLHSLSEYFLSNGIMPGTIAFTSLITTLRILYVILDSYRWKTNTIIFKKDKTITQCLSPILNDPTIEIKS